jgi:cytoskeletal protein CcmA (bactofilin family)
MLGEKNKYLCYILKFIAMGKPFEPENKLPNMIGAGTKIVGTIQTSVDFRIDGIIEGNITSDSKIVIGSSGVVVGEIVCSSAEISGELKGKINVSESLALKSSAKIYGDIKTVKLMVEPGAMFTGACVMRSEAIEQPEL